MRNLVSIVLLVILAAGLSSCEKIKGLFDVEFETTLSGDLDIYIQPSVMKSTASHKFEKYAIVNMFDDIDIAEYDENIRYFEVNGVVAEVISVDKENVVFKSGTILSIYDDTDGAEWTMLDDWPIVKGTKLTLKDIGGEVYQKVKTILDKKGEFKVGAEGESTEDNVHITLRIGIDTKVIANPL